jgi:EAL domain-containing protein (putative c-di-GMP-specific phosphodiesterase class I)/PAS domain-containing protein
MQADGEINLLIAHGNVDQANQLISVLRDTSYTVHSTVIDASSDLNSLLKQQRWDLALLELENQAVQVRDVVSTLKKNNLDVATIVITAGSEGQPYVEGLRMGADYVVPMDEDQYFLLAVANGLTQLEHRRKKDFWKNLYLKAEARCDRLMDNCKDAIAIVQEGTFVFVNHSYSHLFGYQDVDDMLMLPVIDTIGDASQTALKPYLKALSAEQSVEETSIEITGITPDDQAVHTTIDISAVLYQSEPALQFLVPHKLLTPAITAQSDINSTSHNVSDIQPKKVIAAIDQAILKAVRTEERSLFMYIRADQIHEFGEKSGAVAAEQILNGLQEYVISRTPLAQNVLKFSEDVLVALVGIKTIDEGRKYAEDLSREIATKTFSAGEESIALSLSIGVCALNHSGQTAVECLKQCQQAVASGDANLNRPDNNTNIYCFENEAPDRFESEKSVIEFGHLLLEKHLIGIEFQPIAALQGEVAEYYEVLMRPKVDEYPYAVPEDFVDKVFKTKVGGEIDRWVILEAVKTLADKLQRSPETKLFINLSATSIQDSGFTAWLKIALQAANISPEQLIFQFREIDVGRYLNQSEKLVHQLRQLQAQTALTQFGLSINPLLIVDRLAIDFLKLDKILVQEAINGGDAAKPMETVLSSVANSTAQVIVPFIENPSIMPLLWQHGVAYIQGYYVQEPMPTMSYDFIEGA